MGNGSRPSDENMSSFSARRRRGSPSIKPTIGATTGSAPSDSYSVCTGPKPCSTPLEFRGTATLRR
jgi:hypothetical protein